MVDSKSEGQTLQNCIKHEIVKMYCSCILYLMNTKPNMNIKKYFIDCNQYIENNIFSYLLRQKNYACYLSQTYHAKQARIIVSKVYRIELVNYISKQSKQLDLLSEMCSNKSSLEGNLKNHEDALLYGMESLAISQFDKLFCGNKNAKTFIGYYTVGTQQEYLKRKLDAKSSFAYSKKMLKEENGDPKEYEFIKKISCLLPDDCEIIGYKESIENPELTYLKYQKPEGSSINK
ncbi:MAG: hypothetical protein MJ252_07600 [archaeon]|nr:hypothetical protein [archaeon]